MSTTSTKLVLLVSTLFFFFSSSSCAATDFDFFYYVLSWPGSYCRERETGCCLPTTGEPELDFFVKGLYPADSSGGRLTKCNDTAFVVNAIKKLIGDMYSYMPSIKCPSNNGLSGWKKLWRNNGVCSGLTQTQYFNTSLLLRSRINLLPKLKRLGFPPLDGHNYSTGFLQAAMDAAIGKKTKIKCSKNVEGGYQLSEIWMCVDKDGTTIIKCPVYRSFSCPEEILFESFTEDMMEEEEEEEEMSSTLMSFNPPIDHEMTTTASNFL